MALVENWDVKKPLFPSNTKNNVPVVMSSSEKYIPFTCIALNSLLECASPLWFYDIHLLHQEKYSTDSLLLIEQVVEKYSNCRLRIICVENDNMTSDYVAGHVSRETYIRLLIPKIMRNYTDVIYLDSDLIICHDIANLMTPPESDKVLLSGVADLDVIGQYYGPELSMRYYLDNKLRLKSPEQYLQAGVLVFHVQALRRFLGEDALINAVTKCRLRYFDQDILNYMCNERVQLLDWRWNVVNDCDNRRISCIMVHAPQKMYAAYLESRKSPWIVHFSGHQKPWNTAKVDLGNYFWSAVERAGLVETVKKEISCDEGISLWRTIMNKVFPFQSCTREIIKTVFFGIKYFK